MFCSTPSQINHSRVTNLGGSSEKVTYNSSVVTHFFSGISEVLKWIKVSIVTYGSLPLVLMKQQLQGSLDMHEKSVISLGHFGPIG